MDDLSATLLWVGLGAVGALAIVLSVATVDFMHAWTRHEEDDE